LSREPVRPTGEGVGGSFGQAAVHGNDQTGWIELEQGCWIDSLESLLPMELERRVGEATS
jgi:hypothetical protein